VVFPGVALEQLGYDHLASLGNGLTGEHVGHDGQSLCGAAEAQQVDQKLDIGHIGSSGGTDLTIAALSRGFGILLWG